MMGNKIETSRKVWDLSESLIDIVYTMKNYIVYDHLPIDEAMRLSFQLHKVKQIPSIIFSTHIEFYDVLDRTIHTIDIKTLDANFYNY